MNKDAAIKHTLSINYVLRYNTIIGKLEYHLQGEDEFKEVTKQLIKDFREDLRENGVNVTESEIYRAFQDTSFEKRRETQPSEEIEMYLTTVLESRFNIIKQKPEYRYINDKEFSPVDKYFINSLLRQIKAEGLKASANMLNEILFSDYSIKVNPVQQYFNNFDLLDADNHDYIQDLADTVQAVNPTMWKEYFTKWLIACVANVFNEKKCCNHTMLVLTGAQSKFKTTWLNNLCPKDLQNYMYCGKIDTENKDAITNIAECFLINIDDQMKQLNKKDENSIKALITMDVVKYRRPYDIYIQEYPHLASFMGSVNGNDYLTDPTGSRRFLSFEVENINIDEALHIDMNLVWKQAYKMYLQGVRYWFTPDEIKILNDQNADFQVVSQEEQFLLQYFCKPETRDKATHFLQPAEILSYLVTNTHINLKAKALGEALTKLGFEKWRKRIGGNLIYVYSVIQLDMNQIKENIQNKASNKDPFI